MGQVPSANAVQYVARIAARRAGRARLGAAWSHRHFVEDAGASTLVLRGGECPGGGPRGRERLGRAGILIGAAW